MEEEAHAGRTQPRIRSAEYTQRLMIPNNNNCNNISNCTDSMPNVLRSYSQMNINAAARTFPMQQISKLNGGSSVAGATNLSASGNSNGSRSLSSLLQTDGQSAVGEGATTISSIGEQHSNFLNQLSIGTLTANVNDTVQQQHVTKALFQSSVPFTVTDLLSNNEGANKIDLTATIPSSTNILGNYWKCEK